MTTDINTTINRIPVNTYRWLKMNEANVKWSTINSECKIDVDGNHSFVDASSSHMDDVISGVGTTCEAISSTFNGKTLELSSDNEKSSIVKVSIFSSNSKSSYCPIDVLVKTGCTMTVFMDYNCESNSDASDDMLYVKTRFILEENATLNLIQSQVMSDPSSLINDVGGICNEKSVFNLKQLFPGQKQTYSGCNVDLLGKESEANVDIAYHVYSKQVNDMNYIINHIGKNSNCSINVNGVLRDDAYKLFRGTIDFKNGSSGSVGHEVEKVILLGKDSVNKTIPLILCAEEDVVGNHGASIGRLDESTLLYFASRGIGEQEAGNILALGMINALCDKINDEELTHRISSYVERKLQNEY